MDLKVFENPWVIGGGLAVGALILFAGSRGGGSSGGSTDLVNADLSLMAQEYAIGADVTKAQIGANVSNNATLAATFSNLIGAKYARDVALAESNAGVHNADVAASVAKYQDHNKTIVAEKALGTDLAEANISALLAYQQTSLETGAAVKIAKTQARASIFGSLLGAIPKIASGIFGGGSSSNNQPAQA